MTSAVCAVDVGTSAVRAAMIAADGSVLRVARRNRRPGEGATTFDAGLLLDDVCAVLREITTDWTHPIGSVAIAGHIGVVLLDENDEPLGLGRGWADTTGVVPDLLEERELALVGRPGVTGGALPFLTAIAEEDSATVGRIRCVLTPKDYLLYRLGAPASTDATSAAYTLLLDVTKVAWAPQLLRGVGLDMSVLPRLAHGTEVVGAVSAPGAELTGLPQGTPLVAGGPDGTVGAAAVVGTSEDVVVDVAGTTDVLNVIARAPSDGPTGAVVNPYLTSGRWSIGGATGMTGGAVAHWLRLFGYDRIGDTPAGIIDSMEAMAPGCEGLFIVPTLTGSRFPDWNGAERGSLWGMNEHHGVAHILRAAQEAGAFLAREGIERLAGAADRSVALAGGVARSAALTQLRADVLGRPVFASSIADVSLIGAALLAHVAVGSHGSIAAAQAQMGPTMRRFDPDAARNARYTELYESWQSVRHSATADGFRSQKR